MGQNYPIFWTICGELFRGNQNKVEVVERVKRFWIANVDAKIILVVRYSGKPVEFTKGKKAIELANEGDLADTLHKVRDTAEISDETVSLNCTRFYCRSIQGQLEAFWHETYHRSI